MIDEVKRVKPLLLMHVGTGKTGTTSIQMLYEKSEKCYTPRCALPWHAF